MHEEWRDQIMFYAAGTLHEADAQLVRQHLSECAVCRKEHEEWQIIAHSVRSEAEENARRLPPFSVKMRANLQVSSSNLSRNHFRMDTTEVVTRQRVVRRNYQLAATLSATALVLMLLGGLWILMFRGWSQDDKSPTAIAIEITEVALPTGEAFGMGGGDMGILSSTPADSTPVPATATLPSTQAGIIPLNTPTALSTIPFASANICTVQNNNSASDVPLYAQAGYEYQQIEARITPFTSAIALGRTEDGWLRVEYEYQSAIWFGWVYEQDVTVSTECSRLPVLIGTVQEQSFATPTAVFDSFIGLGTFDLILTESINGVSANTLVRVVSAWYDGASWLYEVTTQDGFTFQVRDYQLGTKETVQTRTLIPTPTAEFSASIGNAEYNLITLEQVGAIPLGSRVRIASAWFDGAAWWYHVIVMDETISAEVRASSLGYANQ